MSVLTSMAKISSEHSRKSGHGGLRLSGAENRRGGRGVTLVRAVVKTVTEAWVAFEPSAVIRAEEISQVAACGAPLHASDTAWLNPAEGTTARV
jgi:hypothetical protein